MNTLNQTNSFFGNSSNTPTDKDIQKSIIDHSLKIRSILWKVKSPSWNIMLILWKPEYFLKMDIKDKVKLYYEIDSLDLKRDFLFEIFNNSNVQKNEIDNMMILFEKVDLSDIPGIITIIKLFNFYFKDNYNLINLFNPTMEKMWVIQSSFLINTVEIYSKITKETTKIDFKRNYEYAISIYHDSVSWAADFFNITKFMVADSLLFKFLLDAFWFNPWKIQSIASRFKNHKNAWKVISIMLENWVKMWEIIESPELCEIANNVREDYFERIMMTIRLRWNDLIKIRWLLLTINYETTDFEKNINYIINKITTQLRSWEKKPEKKWFLSKIFW